MLRSVAKKCTIRRVNALRQCEPNERSFCARHAANRSNHPICPHLSLTLSVSLFLSPAVSLGNHVDGVQYKLYHCGSDGFFDAESTLRLSCAKWVLF